MEKKQTVMNQLLTWIKDKNEICNRDFSVGHCNYYTIRLLEIIEAKVNSMTDKEKNQIIDTWYDCKLSIIAKEPMDAEEYYNKTYDNAND